MTSSATIMLWVVLPYAVVAHFVIGHIWRYFASPYTWTTRSTQLLESKLLRPGIILFHVGVLMAFAGHVVGLLIPDEWTREIGMSDDFYHHMASISGSVAGTLMCAGLFLLIYRRLSNERVRATSIIRDHLVLIILTVVVITGLFNAYSQLFGNTHEYRETVAPWLRSIIFHHPEPELMTAAPFVFQLHALAAMALFIIWPFSRLVHAWSLPVGYTRRPYIVFRRREAPARVARFRQPR
ncbi:MAG: respiratory nitrate reductase subunit gamma [Baekduia sp.]